MRLAALDMGSNTVHVLVADVVRGRLEEVAHYVEMPALGPQVARNGVIASGREMLRSAALPIGSGVLADTYLSDPPRPEERARLRKAALRELPHAPDGEVERLVATGGTASNLPTVLTRRNPPAVLTTA